MYVVFGAGAAVAQQVYVANAIDNTFSVIDPATNTQVHVGTSVPAALGMATTPDGRVLYVANNTDIAIVSTINNLTVGTIPIPLGTGAIVVNPNGKYAYTLNPFGGSTLSVLSAGFNTQLLTEVNLNAVPGGLAVSPDGRVLYITDVLGSALLYTPTSNFRGFGIPLAPFPTAVAAASDGARVYVVHPSSNLLTVIDFRVGLYGTIPLPNPNELVVTPDASRVYVSNGANDTVTAIDTATFAIVATIPVGDGPVALTVSPDGAFVYVVNQDSDDVSVISTATNTVTATVAVGDTPAAIAYVVRRGPGSRYQCMYGGWQSFTNPSFENEGQCIAFYNSIH